MDSTAINKLIRHEIWPVLKQQGFASFESRTAFRYRDPFIDVVNFQSFNSHLASGLGCTTASFAVNLGVHVRGGPFDEILSRDKKNRLKPSESQCAFRTTLQKRSMIDGFARRDIFFIDDAGKTAAACLNEVRELLQAEAPGWFGNFYDVFAILRFADEDPNRLFPEPFTNTFGMFPNYGCWAWFDLLANLRVIAHSIEPTERHAKEALVEIEGLIGALLDMSDRFDYSFGAEAKTLRVRSLLMRLRHESAPVQTPAPIAKTVETLNREVEIWALLRAHGFTEFTKRLAHRVGPHKIDIVEILPVDRTEVRHDATLGGTFRLIVGVFWPDLREDGFYRTVKGGQARPTAWEGHLRQHLLPTVACASSFTLFQSTEHAIQQIKQHALPWFDRLADPELALADLMMPDIERFERQPMLRGLGSRFSCLRLLALAVCSHQLGRKDDARSFIAQARAATANPLRPTNESLCAAVTDRIISESTR